MKVNSDLILADNTQEARDIYYENWENDVDESVNELFEWVPDRIEFCDSYFEY